ncbi:MAG: glucuronate isomerase [Clostridia bacterium]|nr:glucuronate isomerase [Clostridia bacterium]
MREDVFLKSQTARTLYENFARELPIIDYHNHVSVADIATDRRFEDLTALWIAPDPYKHRLMRICGIDEHFITGDADPFEKLEQYCTVFPTLAGNPVYDWSRMELSRVFGIDRPINAENARYIYDAVNEKLRSAEFSNNAILARFGIEYQSPVATVFDDLSPFDGVHTAPSLRGDNLLAPTPELIARLQSETDMTVTDTASYIAALGVMLDRFHAAGCRFADHALDSGFFEKDTDGKQAEILMRLGVEYAKRRWTLLLHMDAKRQTSDRLLRVAGPAGGYACVGGGFNVSAVCDLLGDMERAGGLPDTVLFPLNMSDQAPLAVMQGSFSEDGVASKVQLGPAWWWCDHAMGIRNTLSCIASFGVLSRFIGMTTDSRSILSFARHDYFRRLLCSFIAEQNESEAWELSTDTMGDIVTRICYQNALDKIKR